MKHLALALIAIVACKSDKPPTPAPTPTTPSGTGSGSGSSVIAAGSDLGSAGAGSGSAACVIKVTMSQTNISWNGGGVKGQTDFKPGEPAHLDALNGLTKCAVWLVADDKLVYQDVVTTMDRLIKMGLVNVSLADPANSKPGPAPDPSGKLRDEPVVIITKTEVRFRDKVIGKPDDDAITAKLTAVLPKDPKDPTLIIQADKDTSAKTINRVVTAASNQGYANVLFAVKNK